MIPVILSGGSGTRLWPLSRPLYPKQFLALHTDKTLFQETVSRLKHLGSLDPIVVCNDEHRFIVAENLRDIGCTAQNIILEPVGRNTAPAIAAAALVAMKDGDDPILIVLPADHIIENIDAFGTAVEMAKKLASKGALVTFGITPTEAHTGYGYIELGKSLETGVHKIADFKEKPDQETAEEFVKSGQYLWNGGMFCFRASSFLAELKKLQPALLKQVKNAVDGSKVDLDFDRLDRDAFEQCPDISIDYAVMEHTKNGVVVALDAAWSDIGAWDSVWNVSAKDADGNVCKGDVIVHDSKNNLIYSQNKLVSVLGVEGLVVVETQDAILVANKGSVQDVKKIVDILKAAGRSEAKHHRTVYRPWGHYDSICMGERDQVKRITVKPGAKLSLQKHHHRSEHWVVVKGTAYVTKGDDILTLTENESVYLPLGIVHALENPGKIDLEIIEVQTGAYLGEDDIIRLEDQYGRV
ncbi:MAG: mannose-1-phosphate guanylyltransferase/mannose-6-phosphate isomerase [Alphaproteobacteria bacterium]|nr:MAG: mannose-1-phosphate guanylyltransferase/mannose-6-phosphate isomerase [Alphaproteobacteria bacterium]